MKDMSSNPSHLLALSLSGIGNLLMQLPTLVAIKRERPDWKITLWVAPRGTKEIALHHPAIDHVLERPIQQTLTGHIKLIQEIRKQHFDLGLVLSSGQLLKSALYLALAGIPKRVGHRYPLFHFEKSRLFLTQAISEEHSLHDIEQNLNLMPLLGLTLPRHQPSYTLPIPVRFQKQAEEWLARHQLSPTQKLFGMHVGSAAGFTWKRWPAPNFLQVARYALNKNYHVLLFSGPEEKSENEKLARRLGENTVIVTAGLYTIAAIMRYCHAVLSNDSGLMHLSAAAGVATYGLFGPTDERQTGPRGIHSVAIRAPGTKPAYNTERNFALGNETHPSLRALTADQVCETISW